MPTIPRQTWQTMRNAHVSRVEKLTSDHLARRSRNQKHPVWDFLFDYYPVTPGQLAHWSPGAGVVLDGVTKHDVTGIGSLAYVKFLRIDGGCACIDTDAFRAQRGDTTRYIAELLRKTSENPAQFDCFGLHEWAMVYKTQRPRHAVPLRLGAHGTDDVVDGHAIKCTHYDAYRFFTTAARPLNRNQPTRDSQPDCEQAGCLHANMDLYKWATKLGPIIPGQLWLDSFELARDIRLLDMQASPYDLRDWGFAPICIETADGKAEYVSQQRELSARAEVIRSRLQTVISAVLD